VLVTAIFIMFMPGYPIDLHTLSKVFSIKTKGDGDIINITKKAESVIISSGFNNGILTLFVRGSTGAITTLEYETGLIHDLSSIFERIAPKSYQYQHEKLWHDGNGHSHIRASILGPSITIPFIERRLTLGSWQQVVFVELDNKSRSREIITQVIGE